MKELSGSKDRIIHGQLRRTLKNRYCWFPFASAPDSETSGAYRSGNEDLASEASTRRRSKEPSNHEEATSIYSCKPRTDNVIFLTCGEWSTALSAGSMDSSVFARRGIIGLPVALLIPLLKPGFAADRLIFSFCSPGYLFFHPLLYQWKCRADVKENSIKKCRERAACPRVRVRLASDLLPESSTGHLAPLLLALSRMSDELDCSIIFSLVFLIQFRDQDDLLSFEKRKLTCLLSFIGITIRQTN